MSDNWQMATLNAGDLTVIEHLNESLLGDVVKDYLLKVFGDDGERIKWHKHTQREYERCLRLKGRCFGCGSCGAGHPLLGDSLLELIACTIRDIENGRLDLETGEYLKEDRSEFCF